MVDVRGLGRVVVAAAVLVGGLVLAPGMASAGSGGAATPLLPPSVTVGETGIAASITLENRNNGAEAGLTNTVCNAGDASPPCSSPEQGIVFVPSCSQVAAGQCTVAGRDPGVIEVSSGGTGHAGSACAGMTFDAAVIDPLTGATRFTPTPSGTHVTLPGFGSSCIIDFTVSVLKAPTADFSVGTPGLQTAQLVSFTSYTGVLSPGALSNFASGSTSGITVNLASPGISTTASADVVLGSPISDSATVTGRVNPVGSPTVTFQLFGPDDALCATPIFTSTVPYPSGGGPVASASFTPTLAGTYRWIATYSGDANNQSVAGLCGDAQESVVVSTPTTTTTPPTTSTAPPTTAPAVVTTVPEPETTVQPATTLGTIPRPNLEDTTNTVPVTGQRSDMTISWALALTMLGAIGVVLAATRRRTKA